jgi:predicted RNA methylase
MITITIPYWAAILIIGCMLVGAISRAVSAYMDTDANMHFKKRVDQQLTLPDDIESKLKEVSRFNKSVAEYAANPPRKRGRC